jgi:autotransporter-associated beta strand protein
VLGADLSWAGIKIASPGGLVTINSGNTLTIGASGIDLSTATQDLTLNSGLTLRNTGQQSWTAAAGRTLNVAGTFTHTGAVVSFTDFNATATLSGLANDASGILGPWATTGSAATLNYVTSTSGAISTYTGQTTPTNADLSDVTGSNVNYTIAAGATLTVPITANTLRFTGGTGSTLANAGNTITLNGLLCNGSAALTISGAGNLVIGSTKELVVNWRVAFSSITCPVVDNPGGVASSVIINAPNTENTFGAAGVTSSYTGGTTINYPAGGQLNCYSGSFGTGPITLNGPVRFRPINGNTIANSLTINGGGELRSSGTTYSGPITLNSTPQITLGGQTISGNVSGTGGFNVNFNATHLFSGINTYTGQTTVTVGTLKAGRASVANVSGAFGLNSAVTMANNANAKIDLNGFDTQIGSITGGGLLGGNVINSHATTAATLTVGGDNTSPAAYAGLVSGPRLALTKIGTGTLTLTGANSYTGLTKIDAGSLALGIGGSISSSSGVALNGGNFNVSALGSYTLNSLTGSGSVTGDITIGNLSIGNSPGAVTFNDDLTLTTISTFEINGFTSGLYDLASGGAGIQTVNFGGALNLAFAPGFNTAGSVQIFNFENYNGGFSSVNPTGLAVGYTASFNPSNGMVTVVVPEPAAALLGGFSLLALLRRRRA